MLLGVLKSFDEPLGDLKMFAFAIVIAILTLLGLGVNSQCGVKTY